MRNSVDRRRDLRFSATNGVFPDGGKTLAETMAAKLALSSAEQFSSGARLGIAKHFDTEMYDGEQALAGSEARN